MTGKLLYLSLIGVMTLSACDGTLISREQARQVLTMIKAKQQEIISTPEDETSEKTSTHFDYLDDETDEEEEIDYTRLYGEELNVFYSHTYVQDQEQVVREINIQISYSDKCVYQGETVKIGSGPEQKKESYDYWAYLRSSNFYTITSTKTASSSEAEVEKSGSKDLEKAAQLFASSFYTLKERAYELIMSRDRVDDYIAVIDSLIEEPKQRLIYDTYHTKRNSHIVASVTRYRDTSRKDVYSLLTFSYDDNLFRKYEYNNKYESTVQIMTASYSFSMNKPAAFDLDSSSTSIIKK